ncbi:MAG: S8 family serine peptidase [Clostridia bacterium]|nr:S8 family serine peptidase [Clostridia bacterium]
MGVIDSGIDSSHPDLASRVNLTLSRNLSDDNSNAEYVSAHGTHVAGIIGAQGNNEIGISGVCWNVELVSLRICALAENGDVYFSTESVTRAVNYATDNEIDILNISGGGYGFNGSYELNLISAINSFPGLVVCSAGNEGTDNDVEPLYPASHTCSNIISVTSSTEYDQLGTSRNYGATSVDLAAPGEGIHSTVPGNDYESLSGTSMAAPQVAGVAALMLSFNPNLTNQQIKNIILGTVDKLDAFAEITVSGGRLNAYKAVRSCSNYANFETPEYKGGTAFVSSSGWFSTTYSGRVWTGDINGDGRADLMGISTDGHVYYSLANSNGTYGAETKITISNGFANSWFSNGYNQRVWVADVNNDGYDDFIGVSVAGKVYTSINNRNFTFTSPTLKGGTAFVSSSGWFSTAYSGRVWAGDINADGRADLIGVSSEGNVYCSVANSNGTYTAEKKNYVFDGYNESWFSTNYNPRIWVADINADNRSDFFGVNVSGNIYSSKQVVY